MEKWYYENQRDGLRLGLEYTDHLVDDKSLYQKVDVYQTKTLGKLLTLDGLVMTTDKDEFYYHELLTHAGLFTHPNPQDVLIIGGGDGGALREVLKHPEVKSGHLCEIDQMVIDVSKEHFPELAVSMKHPNAKVFVEDGFNFLDQHQNSYDVILVDSTDPIGEAAKLFEEPFIKKVYSSLKEDGLATFQCENTFFQLDVMQEMYTHLKQFFPFVQFYVGPVPTYPSGNWAFLMGSKKYQPLKDFQEKRWNNRKFTTKYYNKDIHFGSFALPQFVQDGLANL